MKYLIGALIGAIIGYITNYIAIKMLFRPYEEKRIFGIKIPFTPGLIPKEKDRIAKSVGDTIGSHLITEETVVNALCSTEVEDSLESFTKRKTEEFISSEKTLDELMENVDFYNEIKANLYKEIEKSIKDIIDESSLENKLKVIVEKEVGDYFDGDKTIDKLVPEEVKMSLKNTIYNNRTLIAEELKEIIKSDKSQEKIKSTISEVISTRLSPMVAMFLNAQTIYDYVMPEVENFLDNEENQKELAELINDKLLEKIFDIKLEDIDASVPKLISEKLTEKISTLISSEKINDKVEEFSRKALDKFTKKPMKELFQGNEDKVKKLTVSIVKELYTKFMKNKASEVFSMLNVSKIVEDKINEFDVTFAEKLILDIASKELRAITLLGALLGAIMGVISPIINNLF